MATRYWVGGSGTWNATTTTNWSASSGGTGGASAPTSADDVVFDSSSGAAPTVTIGTNATCGAVTITAPTSGTLTFAFSTTGVIAYNGNWSSPASLFATTGTGANTTTTGAISYVGSGSSTLTTNGYSFPTCFGVNTSAGTLTLGGALTTTSSISVSQGTFSTSASNYALSATALNSSNSNTRTISLNASTLTLSGTTPVNFATSTNLTFNRGTSQINCSNTNVSFVGGGRTFYNVTFTSTTATTSSKTISGANTFNNLTFSTIGSVGLNKYFIASSLTISGTFTASGANGNQRMLISSSVFSAITLTCNAIAAMTDVDFQFITIAGAAGTLSGTRLGNCGGNSNITFNAGVNKYWNLVGGGNWSSTAWATSSGGTVALANFPLVQDTVIIENTGLTAGNTITIDANWNIGTLDSSTRTNAMTLASGTTNPTFYGNFTYGSGITPTGTGTFTFVNQTTKTLNSGGKTFTQSVFISCPNGGIQLTTNNLTLGSTLFFTLGLGTIDLNNLTLSIGTFDYGTYTGNTRSIAFGTGNITCTQSTNGGYPWYGNESGFSFTGTPTVNISSSLGSASFLNMYWPATSTVPANNNINFNFTSGSYTLITPASGGTNFYTGAINFTGFTGTLNLAGYWFLYGSLTFSSGMTVSTSSTAYQYIFNPLVSTTITITTNGKSISNYIYFVGAGTSKLGDALTCTNTIYHGDGSIDLNGKTLTTPVFYIYNTASNLTFNGGTFVATSSGSYPWQNNLSTYTTTAGTGIGTISLSSSTAKGFFGGGIVYNCTLRQSGLGALTIYGSNTFFDITNTVQPTSVLFIAGTTNTFTNFSLSGTAGNLVTIGSTTAASHTLSKASGTVSVSNCSISYSTATGGASWQAYTSNGNTNGGNNSGWNFASASKGNFLIFF